jgi:hypothetical protein
MRIQRERRPVPRRELQALLVHVNRHDSRADGCGNLDPESSDAAGADEDGDVIRPETSASNRFQRRRHRVGNDGQRRQ